MLRKPQQSPRPRSSRRGRFVGSTALSVGLLSGLVATPTFASAEPVVSSASNARTFEESIRSNASTIALLAALRGTPASTDDLLAPALPLGLADDLGTTDPLAPLAITTATGPASAPVDPAPTAAAGPVPTGDAPVESDIVPEPPEGLAAAAAVEAAIGRIGRPYVWGASGPNSFDCSGLTMWAWGQSGIGLGHYTGSQYAQTQRISEDELLPGDLVFYWSGSGDPSHVGLYIGGGVIVHAPGRGRDVKFDGIYYWSGAKVGFGRVQR